METKFWSPAITSQYTICPIPFHMDTYRGCVYNCTYCFARDFVTFSRRNSDKQFTDLVGNNPIKFRNWVVRTLNKEYDYNKSSEVAFKERIPLKIGATADPFPFIEKTEKITYDILKVLNEYDYPVEIQTKNPEILLEDYYSDLKDANHVIAVTIITLDEEFSKVCEPNAISIKRRLNAIKKLTEFGKKVIIKIQPAIYPKILEELPFMVKAFKESGAFAFNIEGLKCRMSMPKAEQDIFQEIGEYFNINIRDWFKKEKHLTGTDYEISLTHKNEYIQLAKQLASEYKINFYVADNCNYSDSCDSECCGTKVLRDYKIWDNNDRTKLHPVENGSKELGKCFVNFTRNTRNKCKTIDEVMAERDKKNVNLLHSFF